MSSGFRDALLAACRGFGVEPSPRQIELMWRHFDLVCRANTRFNLTRITDPTRAAVEHCADSLTLLGWMAAERFTPRRAVDVGTGGGWPAVPLAIMMPDTRWLAIDSTGKKARFVADAIATLRLRNIAAEPRRAADLAGTDRRFDLVVARAAGKLGKLVPDVARPLCPSGFFVAYKTANLPDDERAEGTRQARRHGLIARPDFAIALKGPDEHYDRRLVVYRRAAG
jgi:16S rRNA (guanine527-N7)-methyltransferase